MRSNILQNAVQRYPGDPQLWIGLGNALVDHARGLTPPAELAYRRAAALAPGHPARALLLRPRAGAIGRSRRPPSRSGSRYLQDAPDDAEWRPLVEQGVAALGGPSAAKPQATTGS